MTERRVGFIRLRGVGRGLPQGKGFRYVSVRFSICRLFDKARRSMKADITNIFVIY